MEYMHYNLSEIERRNEKVGQIDGQETSVQNIAVCGRLYDRISECRTKARKKPKTHHNYTDNLVNGRGYITRINECRMKPYRKFKTHHDYTNNLVNKRVCKLCICITLIICLNC